MRKILSLLCLLFAISAQAQIFPYSENFDTIAGTFPSLNGRAKMTATTNWYVYQRGLTGSLGCAQVAKTAFGAVNDTLTTPVVGPITATSVASFYYRVIGYTAGSPVTFTMKATDKVDFQFFFGGIWASAYSVTSTNQNTGTSYVKVTLPTTGLSGLTTQFRVIATNPAPKGDWTFHLDSILIRDTSAVVGPAPLVITDTVKNVLCAGGNTGSITFGVTGGIPPYKVALNGAGTGVTFRNGAFFNGLTAGTDTITVTDSVNATKTIIRTITQPLAFVVDSISHTNVKCDGGNDGTASVFVRGGTLPYSYLWSPTNQLVSKAVGLAAGLYQFTVTDGNGCIHNGSTTVTSPPTLSISTSFTSTNPHKAKAVVTGGTLPYQYQWTATGASIIGSFTSDTVRLPACPTTFSLKVSVIDVNGCVAKDSSLKSSCINSINDLPNNLSARIYPNPATSEIHIEAIDATATSGDVTLTDLAGRVVLTQHLSSLNTTLKVSALSQGMYIFHLHAGDKETYREIFIQR
jgi:hypothetical protein